MKKRSDLFIPLLLSICIVPTHLHAESTVSHATNLSKVNSGNNDITSSEIQDKPASFPKINHVRFSGNTTISSNILAENIPLKSNDIVNEHVIMDSMVKIAQLYKAKNIKVTIAPVIEKVAINSRDIQFDIHEMPISEK